MITSSQWLTQGKHFTQWQTEALHTTLRHLSTELSIHPSTLASSCLSRAGSRWHQGKQTHLFRYTVTNTHIVSLTFWQLTSFTHTPSLEGYDLLWSRVTPGLCSEGLSRNWETTTNTHAYWTDTHTFPPQIRSSYSEQCVLRWIVVFSLH